MVLRLHGGSIEIHKDQYFLEMGGFTDHPRVSGLNAYGGINMHNNGISNCSNLGSDGVLNISSGDNITLSSDKLLYIKTNKADFSYIQFQRNGRTVTLKDILDACGL